MGYDVSYHPINENEIKQWYFDALKSAREGDWSVAQRLAKEYAMEDFYAQKYINTLKIALETKDDESFSTGYGYILATVQGFLENTSTRAARLLVFWRGNTANLSGI